MPLTGQANYQREYMRRLRAKDAALLTPSLENAAALLRMGKQPVGLTVTLYGELTKAKQVGGL